ncbi:accessory Sec system protein Asp4 [Streptococcus mitis]|uniref:accessory Sec system protein Asp4 n=1 Tax=Streptococcus mitis TaxID=28037 RepID=UPI0021B7EA65|nr:accessory secretory system protein Asp4 [Streptococcus mitis]
MSDEDLFYKDVEGRMEELKQKPIKKEKATRGEKISRTFSLLLALMILIGLISTLIGILR